MKKNTALILCTILIVLLLWGCEKKQILNSVSNSNSVRTEEAISEDSSTQSESSEFSSPNIQSDNTTSSNGVESFSQETLEFLEGVYPDGNPPETIYEVTVPLERLENNKIGMDYLNRREQEIIDEYGTELKYYDDSEKASLLNLCSDTVASANNVAFLLYCSPYFDNGENGAFPLSFAEAQLNVNITCARDTGIKVSSNSSATRMYSIVKCDAGGYIYVFFDDISDKNTMGRLKSIIYIDKLYSYDEVSFIKEGTPLEDVLDMSPTLAYCFENQTSEGRNIIIPLTDGVMALVADISNTQTILSADYYPDSVVPNPDGYAQSEERAYNFTILPQDYPPAS